MTPEHILKFNELSENELFLSNSFRNIQQEAIEKHLKELVEKKNKVIIDRFNSFGVDIGKKILTHPERFRREIQGNIERYFYNENLIITFETKQEPIDYNSDKISISANTTYY